ncbi:porin [Rheinheimera baltica]|nr:porin [Rheinheimera baltica]MDP5143867.1 porin [Rheinheimera baltica]MDP5151705.1 porin [Rheinheimera baltica]MDP5189708.1 porin [Rheinheimera baltica]
MKKSLLSGISSIVLLLPYTAMAEINISGFATIAGGRVLSGSGVEEFGLPPTFLANYPQVGVYEEEWSFKPDSRMGLQLSADLMDGLKVTGQIVARGADDFNASFEWAYISYQLNDTWTIQAGKKRLPLYYYSDFFDVGFAYLWLRPPADNYTWQIFNYTGINALFNTQLGSWDVSGNIYTGREDDKDNKLLSQFFGSNPVQEIWKDIVGGVVSFNRDWLDVRLTYMTYINERYVTRDGVVERVDWDGDLERRGKFAGISINIDYNDVVLLTELNQLDLEGSKFDTYMVSLGYRFNSITPYISYADFDSDGEVHNTTSLGFRYDFHSSAAFKLQYDDVKDDGYDGLMVAGDSKSITFGVDLVF